MDLAVKYGMKNLVKPKHNKPLARHFEMTDCCFIKQKAALKTVKKSK